MIAQIILSFFACMGFGILFNIRGKNLLFASLSGAISWFVYILVLSFNFSNTTSLLISSICFSIYSEIFARILKTPVTSLIICGLITLVPGAGMYNTMYQIILGNLETAVRLGLETLASAGTLALGILFVSTTTKIVAGNLDFKKSKIKDV